MKRVLTAVVLIPLVVLLVLKAPTWLLALVAWAIALLATREYLSLVASYGFPPYRRTVYAVLTLIFVVAALESRLGGIAHPSALSSYLPLAVLAFGMLLVLAMREPQPRSAMPGAVLSGFALVYVVLPLLLLVEWAMPTDVLYSPSGRMQILAVLLIVWSADIMAYLVGRAVGKHMLAPRISPKKTWEGAVGSMLGSLLVGAAISPYFTVGFERLWLGLVYWLAVVVAINIAAQLGDLVESLMKRGAGVKDSGSILPGHGGMLDRIDALLFAVPVAAYLPSLYWMILRRL